MEATEAKVLALSQRVNTVVRGQPTMIVAGALANVLTTLLAQQATALEPPSTWNRSSAQRYLVWLLDDLLIQLIKR